MRLWLLTNFESKATTRSRNFRATNLYNFFRAKLFRWTWTGGRPKLTGSRLRGNSHLSIHPKRMSILFEQGKNANNCNVFSSIARLLLDFLDFCDVLLLIHFQDKNLFFIFWQRILSKFWKSFFLDQKEKECWYLFKVEIFKKSKHNLLVLALNLNKSGHQKLP